jgi:hypothetical protein
MQLLLRNVVSKTRRTYAMQVHLLKANVGPADV